MPGGDFLASHAEQAPPPPPDPPAAEPELELERWREGQESDRHWALRKQFLRRHWPRSRGAAAADQLLALSRVWTNHVFLGCR